MSKLGLKIVIVVSLLTVVAASILAPQTQAVTYQQSGAVGVEGTVPSNPPTSGAVITVPSNGQSFTSIPINVAGLCPKGLLVEIFDNGVFVGSSECPAGSFALQVDLFDGRNDLVAKVFDALNQTGPDSNTVTVTFRSGSSSKAPKIAILTDYAKRGAAPGSSLTWPFTLSGGEPPYAVIVDWGDKSPPSLISRASAGDFTVDHIYSQSGVYKVVIKASDANGDTAFLQIVGVGNGPISQAKGNLTGTREVKVIVWWPLLVALVLIIAAFWAGKKHQLEEIRERLRRGERPFK